MALGDIVVRIRGDAKSFSAASRAARAENQRFGSTVVRNNAKAASSFKQVERAAFQLRARMVGLRAIAIGTSAVFTGRGVVQYADAWKLAEARIASVTGDLGVAKQEMAELVQLANRSRGSIETLANSYSKLRLSRDELNKNTTFDLIETLQKSLIIGGNTSQEVRSVILQLTQGIAADQLGGEELRTIRESGFFFQKILADGLGVNVGELKQLGAESKLTAKAVTDAVVSMSDRVDAEFQKIPVTVGQASVQLTNNFRQWVGTADEATGATALLAKGIQSLGQNIGPVLNAGLFTGAAAGAITLTRAIGGLSDRTIGFVRNIGSARAAELASAQSAKTLALAKNQENLARLANARTISQENIANIASGRSTLTLAQQTKKAAVDKARLVAANKALTTSSNAVTAAIVRETAALRAMSLSARATGFALGALRGALAFVGGPVGAGILAIAAGFALWKKNAREAAEQTRLLAQASEDLAQVSARVNGEGFIQTASQKQQTIKTEQERIEALTQSYKILSEQLRALDSVTQPSQELIPGRRGRELGQTRSVPGRSLSLDEEKERNTLRERLSDVNDQIAASQDIINVATAKGIVTQKEYEKSVRESATASSGFVEPVSQKFLDSLTQLRSKVSEARAEFEAFGGSSGEVAAAVRAQEIINDLTGNGVVVTKAMENEIRGLTEAYGEYTDQLRAATEFERVQDRLISKVAEARAKLQNGGADVPAGLEAINSLTEKGIVVTDAMRDALNGLGAEYATIQGQIDATKEAQDAYNSRLEDAKSLAEANRSPLEVYRDRIKEISDLQKEFPNVIDQVAGEKARATAAATYAEALKGARSEQLKLSESLADGILNADSLGDALRNFGSTLQKFVADKFLLKPLTGFIDKGLSGLGGLAGGGAANDNSGAVDEFGNAVTTAGAAVKGSFLSSITSSVTGLFGKKAADTAATAVTTTETTTRTAHVGAIGVHTAAVATSTAALATFTAATTAAAASAGAGGISGGLKSLGTFAGGFAKGGRIPQGQFGLVGENEAELAFSGNKDLTIVPFPSKNTSGPVSGPAGGGQGRLKLELVTNDEMFRMRVAQTASPIAQQAATSAVGQSNKKSSFGQRRKLV